MANMKTFVFYIFFLVSFRMAQPGHGADCFSRASLFSEAGHISL